MAGEGGVPAKKSKCSCKFQQCWAQQFTCILPSHINNLHAFCKVCRIDFNVAYGGENDITQHIKTQRHHRAEEAHKGTRAISSFIMKEQTEAENVKQAELKMAMLVAQTVHLTVHCGFIIVKHNIQGFHTFLNIKFKV